MKISNNTNYYPILIRNNGNNEKKNINNNSNILSSQTNPFGAFYNFQAINSIAFAGRAIKRPPFYVVDKDCNIVKDEQGNPMEFTSAYEVRTRLGLTASKLERLNSVLNENSNQKTFSHEDVKYTCILKDDVIEDGELNEELLKNKVQEIFTHGGTILRSCFYVVDENYNIAKDKQDKPIEFASAPEVRNRLGLTSNELKRLDGVLENGSKKTFSHEDVKYTCILKDDVTEDGELNEELIKSKAREMFTHGGTTFHNSFYIVDEHYNIVKDEQGKPIEFTSAPEARSKLGLTPSERKRLSGVLNENTRHKTFSHEGVKYTCVLKDKVSDSDGLIDNDMLKNEAEKMFNGRKASKG